MNRKRTQGQRITKKKLLIIGIVLVATLIVAIFAVIRFQSSTNSENHVVNKQQTSTVTTQTTKSNGTNVLQDFTEKATEDSDTRTGGDTTYSQFYKQNNIWYWKLTSNNRGTLEVGKISKVVLDNSDYLISITSQVYQPGTKYQLNLHWLDQKVHKYNLHTDFKSINGNYTLGVPAESQQINTRNLTKNQIKNWIVRNINKYESDGSQAQNDDPGYYYFEFSRDKAGCIDVFVTENHDYANKHGDDVAPGVAPTVGSFQITKEGYLRAYNVGTGGLMMVKKVTGDAEARSAIVARSFDE